MINDLQGKGYEETITMQYGLNNMNDLKANIKTHLRQNFFKHKVWIKPRPYYQENAQNKKKLVRTNIGPIKVWAHISQIVSDANMPKGRNKTTILMPRQWLTIRYKKNNACILNPNTKRGSKCGFWKKPQWTIISIYSLVSPVRPEVHCWN